MRGVAEHLAPDRTDATIASASLEGRLEHLRPIIRGDFHENKDVAAARGNLRLKDEPAPRNISSQAARGLVVMESTGLASGDAPLDLLTSDRNAP